MTYQNPVVKVGVLVQWDGIAKLFIIFIFHPPLILSKIIHPPYNYLKILSINTSVFYKNFIFTMVFQLVLH